ncbi:MAG: ROK family protein [Victivallales bacterium]|nr:ROK family protein [Victivallales bacterium]
MNTKELLKLKNIRLKNTVSALNMLRTADSFSRVELAREMNCDGTAVTRITRDLISKGVLITAGMAKSKSGRPREKIELNVDWKHAIGIELSPTHITGVLTNLKGRIITREQVFLSSERTRNEFVKALELVTGRLLNSCDSRKLLGIGIATFGPFSGKNKILGEATSYPALKKFNIREFFTEEFDIVPEIADATFARALYEIWFKNLGNKGIFLLFNIGAGIGCAAAIDGKIVFERHANIGEFGHTIYKVDGDLCACGRRGCLETLCSTGVIENSARKKTPGKELLFPEIARDYAAGNNEFADIIDNCACWLGIAIANQINFLVPDEIVLTGEILLLGNRFYEKVFAAIKKYAFPIFMKNVSIIKSESWEENASLGAASLLVRKVFEDIEYINEK